MYHHNLKINGVDYPLAVNIKGAGAPTSLLEAEIGMFYMDETNGEVYKLTPEGWKPLVENSGEGGNGYVLTEDDKKEIANMLKGKTAKIGEVTLLASAWVGENSLYSQIVEIEGVTEYSQVDLTPDIQQLAIFYNKDITFVTENEDGVVTVFVIGQKPENDYTIQVTITEVGV